MFIRVRCVGMEAGVSGLDELNGFRGTRFCIEYALRIKHTSRVNTAVNVNTYLVMAILGLNRIPKSASRRKRDLI